MKKFDLRTHIRDGDGRVVRKQPYRMVVNGSKTHFERDGKAYHPNGEYIGNASIKSKEIEKEDLNEQGKELLDISKSLEAKSLSLDEREARLVEREKEMALEGSTLEPNPVEVVAEVVAEVVTEETVLGSPDNDSENSDSPEGGGAEATLPAVDDSMLSGE